MLLLEKQWHFSKIGYLTTFPLKHLLFSPGNKWSAYSAYKWVCMESMSMMMVLCYKGFIDIDLRRLNLRWVMLLSHIKSDLSHHSMTPIVVKLFIRIKTYLYVFSFHSLSLSLSISLLPDWYLCYTLGAYQLSVNTPVFSLLFCPREGDFHLARLYA